MNKLCYLLVVHCVVFATGDYRMNTNTKDVTSRSVEDCFMVLHGAPLKNASSTFHCNFNTKQCYSNIEWTYLKGNW